MSIKQLALELPAAEPLHSFDSFFEGPNALLLERLRAVIQAPTAPPQGALFLHGGAGCGKTHLLRATAAASSKPLLLSAADGKEDWPIDSRGLLVGVDWHLALLDDVHALNSWQQRAVFMIYEDAIQRRTGLVAASALPLPELKLRPDVLTRLGWGASFEVQPLEDEDKLLALRSAASARGFEFSEELARWVMTHCTRDMRSLMSLVERLDRYSLGAKRSVSLQLVKAMLAEDAQ